MNKRIFGIRIGTIVTVVVCIAVAVALWMIAKYKISNARGVAEETAYISSEAL